MSSLVKYLRNKYNREVMNPEQVAEEFDITIETVWQMIQEGQLPAMQLGNSVRISIETLVRVFSDSLPINKEEGVQIHIDNMEINRNSTLENYLNYWIRMSQVDDQTKRSYRDSAKSIAREIGTKLIGDVTSEDIIELLEKFREKYKLSTLQTRYKILKLAFSYAVKRGIIEKNPLEVVKMPRQAKDTKKKVTGRDKVDGQVRKALTLEEIKEILTACKMEKSVYTMAKLVLFTGLRPGELRSLIWQNIDFEKQYIYVETAAKKAYEGLDMTSNGTSDSVIGRPKSESGVRAIPFNKEVLHLLTNWREYLQTDDKYKKARKSPFVFPSTRDGGMLGESGISRRFINVMKKSGLDGRGYELYRFRYTFGNYLMREVKADIITVQELMGHYKPDVLLTYYLETTRMYKERAISSYEEYMRDYAV